MITKDYLEDFNSPLRKITGKAELFTGSADTKSGKYVVLDNPIVREKAKVKVSSKNLFDASRLLTECGWVEENGYLVGKASDAHGKFGIKTEGFISLEGIDTISMSFRGYIPVEGKSGLYFAVVYDDGSYEGIGGVQNTTETYSARSLNLNRDPNKKPKKLCLTYSNYGGITYIKDIQLEIGTTATPYTPYIESGSNTEIMVSGKNLWDEETKFTSLGFKKQEDGTWLANNYHGTVFTPSIGSNQMFFRAIAKSTKAHTSTPFIIRVYYTDGTYSTPFALDNNQTDWVELQGSSNASKIISSIRFSFGGSTPTKASYYIKELMFSYADSAYESYNKEPTYYTATVGEEIEVEPYAPTTVIVPSSGAYIEKASYFKEVVNTFSHSDALQSITIDRIGEKNKFFGFIVSQKATINLLDRNRELEISNGNCFKTYFNINENNFVDNFPRFFVSEAKRNETTNALTITANDVFSAAAGIPVSELGLESYTIRQFAEACAARLDLKLVIRDVEDETVFDTQYDEGANFEGTESLRDAIKAIAEATQTICYASPDSLVFRRLKAAAADLNIEKKHYFNLTNKGVKTLANICHATELGDNVISSSSTLGETQYVRDNPFWELKEDIATLVDNAIAAIGGVSFNAFECKWRGNFLAEIGDRLDITTKDDNIITSYLLDDTITYKGGYSQKSSWVYESGKEETPSNPSTLGEVIKQTFAKVDKANRQIDMIVSESSANKEAIAALQLNTNSINASVSQLEKDFKENKDTTADDIATLKSKVDLQITPDDVTIAIQKEMANGVDKVETTTGYKFSDEGLDITKSNSEVSTKITHEGMTVAAAGNPVLTANHEGVEAVDLHATTYLIIGNYSRFEDYDGRTGCFWIGGNS